MSEAKIAKALGKIIIALAWADGEIQQEEKECLKDLLYQLPDLPATEIQELEALMNEPIGETEREVFLMEFTQHLKYQRQKDFALYALDRVVNADGVVTKSEERVIDLMRETIDSIETRNISRMEEIIKNPLSRIPREPAKTTGRNNPVDAFVQKQADTFKTRLDMSEPELKKLALAGFLMARVVRADNRIKDQEVQLLREFIRDKWELENDAVEFVVRICLSEGGAEVDLIRACRVFYELTDEPERVAFLDILFKVAMVDDVLTDDEIQEVINISANLKLEHNYFHEAFNRTLEESGLPE